MVYRFWQNYVRKSEDIQEPGLTVEKTLISRNLKEYILFTWKWHDVWCLEFGFEHSESVVGSTRNY